MSTLRGRTPEGQIIKRWRERDGQFGYALRVRVGAERVYLRLGLETDGWNDRAAEAELARVTQEIAAGIWRPPAPDLDEGERDPGFHEFASWWLAEREPNIGPSTYEDYRNLLSRHLLPFFARYRLSEINYETMARYRTAKQQESKRLRAAHERGIVLRDRQGELIRPFGPRQINASIALLARFLARAVKSESFALTSNPARERDLRVRRDVQAARRHLEADEVLAVLDAALQLDRPVKPTTVVRAKEARRLRDDLRLPWKEVAQRLGCAESTAIWLYQRDGTSNPGSRQRRTMIAVLALSGLRSAEATGLRWRNVDFTHGRIVVSDSKTVAGVREVDMSPFLRDELLVYRAAFGEIEPNQLVFPARGGTPHTRQNVNRRVIAPAVRLAETHRSEAGEAELPPRITAHTFRRTYVTLCAQFGRSLSYVQAQVGHTDANTTNRYYVQGSRGEADPRIRALLAFLLGEGEAPVEATLPLISGRR